MLSEDFPQGANIGFGGYTFNEIDKYSEEECSSKGGVIYADDLCELKNDYCDQEN